MVKNSKSAGENAGATGPGAGRAAIPGYLERDIVDLSSIWSKKEIRLQAASKHIAMITRVWHGTTRATDAERYLRFLLDKGIRDYLRTPGNQEVRVGRRIEGDIAHFYTISTWDDLDSVRAFAGDPVDRARYYPEDEDFLLSFEPTVLHYETFRVNA